MTVTWKEFFSFMKKPLSPDAKAALDRLYDDWKKKQTSDKP